MSKALTPLSERDSELLMAQDFSRASRQAQDLLAGCHVVVVSFANTEEGAAIADEVFRKAGLFGAVLADMRETDEKISVIAAFEDGNVALDMGNEGIGENLAKGLGKGMAQFYVEGTDPENPSRRFINEAQAGVSGWDAPIVDA